MILMAQWKLYTVLLKGAEKVYCLLESCVTSTIQVFTDDCSYKAVNAWSIPGPSLTHTLVFSANFLFCASSIILVLSTF